ncbi:type II toxin-antitoxin system RelE/ParE family toxin [Cytophaga aurantiaca]|uniref:type II toxin-antitoxin system RelE/ParE family toxin n=1 Tax=Cytophaga aurantiaca TaxID=29530 RepID=UPI00037A2B42|nr:type II toxin-antitoxin system RelE/ParE family toxin [Cytophaga aurantiaca]
MDQKEVIWSIKAKEELYNILDFYINRNGSPTYSLKLLSDSEDITQLLKSNHYLGRLTENRITRVIVKDAYLIFYEIGKDYIEIISYWDNRQDSDKRIDRE